MENDELEVTTEQTAEEPAAEEAQEAPAPEEAQEAAAEMPPPAKKSKLPLIIAIVIVVLAAGGFLVYQNLPSTKASKMIIQAQEYRNAKDYAQAVETLVTARETDPGNQYVRDAFLAVFDANARDLLSADIPDYEGALEVYLSAESIIPDDIETLFQKEAEILKLWAKADAASNDKDVIVQQIEKLTQAIERGLPGLGITKTELEKQFAQIEANEAVNEFALIFTEPVNAADIGIMVDVFNQHVRNTESDLYKKAISKRGKRASSFPILSDPIGDCRLGIYYKNNEYFVYYGLYDESGKRSGDGIWITTRGELDSGTYRTYFYHGNWENDKPNGTFFLSLYTRFGTGGEETKTASANLKDGLFDGVFVYTYTFLGNFTVTYSNGDPVPIDTRQDSDGSSIIVYGYNEDQTKMLNNLPMHDGVFGTY